MSDVGPSAPVENPESPTPTLWRREFVAAAACAAVSLLLAVTPHLVTFARSGTLEYVSDNDEVFYLSVARTPYYGELTLRDPYSPPWQPLPSLYAWCQFVPTSLLTRWLGLGPLLTSLVWRAVGGVLLGPTVYLVFRRVFADIRRPTAWALALTLVCLCDAGFVEGRSFLRAETLVRSMLSGEPASKVPNALVQYRVVSPITNLPPLLVLLAVLVPAGRRGVGSWLVGSLALGLCVGLYFFMWTGAVIGLCLTLAVWLGVWVLGRSPDLTRRARGEFLLGTAVLVGGLAVGSPQILANARASVDPELKPVLQRMSRGQNIPPGHPARSRFVKNYWAIAKVGFGAVAILALGVAGLRLVPLWATAFAGYLLLNNALVTGLEFENFHWLFVTHPVGEITVLAGFALLWQRLNLDLATPRVVARLAWAAPLGLFLVALAYRGFESARHPEAAWTNGTLRALDPIRPELAALKRGDVLAGPNVANIALLLGNAGQLYQFNNTPHASPITDLEVHERHALNSWLNGETPEQYHKHAAESRFPLTEVTRPEWTAEAVAASREALFQTLLDDPARSAALLDRFRPDALLRPTGAGEPPRGGPWSRAASGEAWTLWTRTYPPRG